MLAADAVVIPFGGGTNISGQPRGATRTRRARWSRSTWAGWTACLEIDADARLARVQAGALGPDLEEQLNAQGWTIGHFPD